jgi:Na+-driven multidrug efflux pump
MIFSFVIFRQIYLFVATHIVNNIYVVGFGYPAGWIMCSALFMLYYRFSGWEKRVHV